VLAKERPDWWDHAVCRGRHDLLARFVPPTRARQRGSYRRPVDEDLARLCKHCPVKKQCYADGFMDAYAVRGGTTAAQRQAVRFKRRSLNVRAG
jgi:hypothetical protein